MIGAIWEDDGGGCDDDGDDIEKCDNDDCHDIHSDNHVSNHGSGCEDDGDDVDEVKDDDDDDDDDVDDDNDDVVVMTTVNPKVNQGPVLLNIPIRGLISMVDICMTSSSKNIQSQTNCTVGIVTNDVSIISIVASVVIVSPGRIDVIVVVVVVVVVVGGGGDDDVDEGDGDGGVVAMEMMPNFRPLKWASQTSCKQVIKQREVLQTHFKLLLSFLILFR